MRSTVQLCEDCGSAIVKVKHGTDVSVECSYCGKPYDNESQATAFDSSYDGEDDGEV